MRNCATWRLGDFKARHYREAAQIAQGTAETECPQVCALQWNTHEKEILSSHGFSQNQLCLWRYPSMAKVGEFNGHTSRVLHLAQSPDGTSVCSAAADETLRFWRVFGEPAKIRKAKTEQAERISLRRTIR